MWLRLERGTRVAGVAASVMRMRSAERTGCRVLTAAQRLWLSTCASGRRADTEIFKSVSMEKSMEL